MIKASAETLTEVRGTGGRVAGSDSMDNPNSDLSYIAMDICL